MKPINRDDNGCVNSSSTCVVYDGKDLDCVGIKNGDCLTKIVHDLACKLCTVLDELSISEYDFSCLNLQQCAPKDFTGLLQLLIDRICALQGVSPTAVGQNGCPNCVVQLATCFYYPDPKTGDQVITAQLTDYITLIGNTICGILNSQGQQQGVLVNHGQRLGTVEQKVTALQNAPTAIPSITPDCVLTPVPTTIDIVLQALEKQFCELRAATGLPNDLFKGISAQPAGLNTQNALGTQGGKMDSIPGWKSVVENVADSLTNIWLTIGDLRNAVTNIQLNCCPTPCSGLSVKLQVTMPNINQIILYFTGSIPVGLLECSIAGTLFTITDQSGHSINVTIPLAANINNPGGYPVTISGTPLNTADNFTITSDICFKNNTTGTTCDSCLEYVFVNTLNCPTVTFIAGLTTMAFSFSHTSGQKTYTVALYDSTGNTLLQSMIFPETNPATVSGTFNGLTMGTTYKVRVFILGTNGLTTTCPFTVVTTLPNPCPAPSAVTAIITIP